MEVGFFSSTIVQVAISIVISWALFALLCSMLHEVVVQLKSERGRFYRAKIIDKLFDASNQINWGLLMYGHSNIKLLTNSEKAPPSEIDSKTLAEVLIDSVANAQAAKILKLNSSTLKNDYASDLLNNLEFAITNLGQSDVILMLRNAFDKAKIKAIERDTFNEEKLYTELVSEITLWFEQFGSRTSSWYKKLSQKRLFALGVIVAICMNVDSIALFEYYKENPTARAALIDYYSKNKTQLEALSTINDTIKIDSTSTKVAIYNIRYFTKQIDSLKQSLELPIGWEKANCMTQKSTPNSKLSDDTDSKKTIKHCRCISISCLLFKILGIIISAFAASLGAPFWFDLLRKATTSSGNLIQKK